MHNGRAKLPDEYCVGNLPIDIDWVEWQDSTQCPSVRSVYAIKLCTTCTPHAQVGPYRQSERGEIYKEMADKLVAAGHAYPCFCTEEELAAKREQVNKYPRC